MYILNYIQTTFFLGRFLKKLADDHFCSITKDSIYHIKYMSIQPFTMGVDWPEFGMFNGSIYYVWYLHLLRLYIVRQKYYWTAGKKNFNLTIFPPKQQVRNNEKKTGSFGWIWTSNRQQQQQHCGLQ